LAPKGFEPLAVPLSRAFHLAARAAKRGARGAERPFHRRDFPRAFPRAYPRLARAAISLALPKGIFWRDPLWEERFIFRGPRVFPRRWRFLFLARAKGAL
jgi:hypothetical protein